MNLATFKLTGTGIKAGKLVINGLDVTQQVRAMQFTIGPGEVPRFIIESYTDDFELEGEGIVHVIDSGAGDVLGFLGALNVEAIEQEVLRRQSWGTNTVELVIGVLKELAGGDPT